MDEWEQEGLNLRKKLRERLDQTREVEDQEIYRQIDDLILEETRNRYVSLRRKEALRTELFNSIRKLDILQELIDDDSVTEIMVNGTEGIFLERNGRLLCWEKKITSKEKLEDMVQQIAGRCNRIVNESVPVADARLSDGSRVSLVLPPVALNGPVITIRRFPKNPIHMDRLVELGAVTTEAAAFLRALVRSGYNIFISGGTGSGKTTFLNALSDFIPKEERIITIEDNAELQIQGAENLVRLEARQANTEGKNSVTIRDLFDQRLLELQLQLTDHFRARFHQTGRHQRIIGISLRIENQIPVAHLLFHDPEQVSKSRRGIAISISSSQGINPLCRSAPIPVPAIPKYSR